MMAGEVTDKPIDAVHSRWLETHLLGTAGVRPPNRDVALRC